ncbi:MAG: hypothetical protein ABEI97_04240, partial [Candidatus Nanohaloarchaea archaeon]
MSSTHRTGYEQKREKVLTGIGAFLLDSDFEWTPMRDVHRFMQQAGYSDHEIWTGVNAFAAAGLLQSVDRGGRTELRLLEESWDLDEFPEYAAASETGEEWAELRSRNDWTDIGETAVPTLSTDLFMDFLDRHGYYDADVRRYQTSGVEAVASYDATGSGDKEYWRIVVNDEQNEEDRAAVMVKFNKDGSAFQPRNRRRYAEEVWTPLLVLQQRNAWANQASRDAAAAFDDLQSVWAEMTGDNVTVEEAYMKELASLAGTDGDYEELRDAVVDRYTGNDDLRLSRVLAPYAGQVESRLEEGWVREG